MSQTTNFDVRGLWTNPNDVSKVPRGSLRRALNIDLSKTGLIGPRRGFDIQTTLSVGVDRAKALFFYNSEELIHTGSTLLLDDGSLTSLGALTKPTGAYSVKMFAMQQNAYFTSSAGIKKLDSLSGQLYQAGMPKGLMLTATANTGTGTAVLDTMFVSYRYLIARKDANNNVIFGGVSNKYVVKNTSGVTKDYNVRVYLPSGLSSEYFVQLYRSPNSIVEAINDELQLAFEVPITSTNVSNGYLDILDIVPDDLLGATIYTASSQETAVNDNGSGPPLANDITEYKGCLFYANVQSRHAFGVTLVAVGSTGNGLQLNDTITISDGTTTEVYTAKAAENLPNKEFAIDASVSLSLRIDLTARSLINVVNRTSTLVYVYSALDETGLPGKMRFEAKSLGTPAFMVVSTRAPAWSPQLQATANAAQTSTNDAFQHGLMFSKKDQPEAVPLKNLFKVGASDDPIQRIIALRDGLFIVKSGGVYILTGETESDFTVTLLDSTCKIIAPDSITTLNNLIYGLFEAGIGELSTSGVDYISEPVQDKLQVLFGSALTATAASFAFGVQTEGKYYLCLPTSSEDTYSTYQLVYNLFAEAFVEGDFQIGCGNVGPDGKIRLGAGDSNVIKIERKDFDYTDFADYQQAVTMTSYVGQVVVVDGADEMSEGDILYQDGLQPAYIESIDLNAGTVTLDIEEDWNTALPVSHFKAIEIIIEWNREFADNPAGFKHFSEIILLFKQTLVRNATLSFSSDVSPATTQVGLDGPTSTFGWGFQPWGDGVWGGEQFPEPFRRGVPQSSARCNALSVTLEHRIAYSDFLLSGLSLVFNPTSTRVSR